MRCVTIVGLVVVLWCSGCTKRNPAVCCTTTEDCAAKGLPEGTNCADGLRCVQNECELPQSCQANSDCEAPTPMCAPDGVCGECLDSSTCGDGVCDGATHSCRDCTSDDECATGFCSPATNRCAPGTITPRYLPTICDTPATSPLEITADAAWLTSDECDSVISQTIGPSICVVRRTSFRLAPSVRLKVDGFNALAIVADSELVIDGVLDASAEGLNNGPGVSGSDTAGSPSTSTLAGGGGGGLRTRGGHGGTETTGGAQNGGPLRDPSGSSLLAGARGGGVAEVEGGGGGGAITLISCRGHVEVGGIIDVGGGGGLGGKVVAPAPQPYGGAGGGAGGSIVLQGRLVTVTGQLFANGGAGGGGRPDTSNSAVGATGGDGMPSESCAETSVVFHSASGGDGGCVSAAAQDGATWKNLSTAVAQPSAGGGGGSVGFLQALTPAGVVPMLTPAAVSPALDAPGTLETH